MNQLMEMEEFMIDLMDVHHIPPWLDFEVLTGRDEPFCIGLGTSSLSVSCAQWRDAQLSSVMLVYK